jgi:hypothetical protein
VNTVWLVSEIYGAQEDSTGHLLNDLARGLARDWPVKVIACDPHLNGSTRTTAQSITPWPEWSGKVTKAGLANVSARAIQ